MSNRPKNTCVSSAHQNLVEKLMELEERFSHLQAARKEGRHGDLALLETQISQKLCEWRSELSAPSPESSLLGGSISQYSEEIARLLKLNDEKDDATSSFKDHTAPEPEDFAQRLCPSEWTPEASSFKDHAAPEPEDFAQSLCPSEWTAEAFNQTPFNGDFSCGLEDAVNNTEPHGEQLHYGFDGFDPSINTTSDFHDQKLGNLDITSQLYYHLSEMRHELDNNSPSVKLDGSEEFENYAEFTTPTSIHVPPYAFLRPKCALWDCTRPAQGSDWYQDYCSDFHANLALNEDSPGAKPVLRPGGISVKDNLLIDAVRGKTQGKNVGIPVCEGANRKCPWNQAELFDLELVERETIREWLYFDKSRKAYESGDRKQRGLPDYSGRGWHESSRRLVMKEQEGEKRSYYMDPQPSPGVFDWHLYEYTVKESDECVLYRLEYKKSNGKKSPKGKVAKDPLADLQKKMGELTAQTDSEKPSPPTRGRKKTTKGADTKTSNEKLPSSHQ